MKNLKDLQDRLEVKFKDEELLKAALIHRSYLNEARIKNLRSNERLEFLGDSILSFIVSSWLYGDFPDFPEGNLTNIRSNLVKTDSLAIVAQKIGIGDFLLLSKGEKESGGQNNPVLLANMLEAIVGALFLDQGLKAVEKFVKSNLKELLRKLVQTGKFKDYKSLLQETIQAEIKNSPVYRTIKEEGPDHAKIFTIGVYSQNKLIASGKGKSKQSGEEEAAKAALKKLIKSSK